MGNIGAGILGLMLFLSLIVGCCWLMYRHHCPKPPKEWKEEETDEP